MHRGGFGRRIPGILKNVSSGHAMRLRALESALRYKGTQK